MLATLLLWCIHNMNNYLYAGISVDNCTVVPELSTALYLDRQEKVITQLFVTLKQPAIGI